MDFYFFVLIFKIIWYNDSSFIIKEIYYDNRQNS